MSLIIVLGKAKPSLGGTGFELMKICGFQSCEILVVSYQVLIIIVITIKRNVSPIPVRVQVLLSKGAVKTNQPGKQFGIHPCTFLEFPLKLFDT